MWVRVAVGFSLKTTLQGGESLELYNIYAALATVISKPVVYSCAEDRANLLLCLPLPSNNQGWLWGPESSSSQCHHSLVFPGAKYPGAPFFARAFGMAASRQGWFTS